jgi:prefoldin subunit 5
MFENVAAEHLRRIDELERDLPRKQAIIDYLRQRCDETEATLKRTEQELQAAQEKVFEHEQLIIVGSSIFLSVDSC